MDDFSEIADLVADLTNAPSKAAPLIEKAVKVTAHHIKDDWRQGAERNGLRGYAASIDYDVTHPGGNSIQADIGPNLGKRQGAFGFVEDGGGGVKSAPQHAGRDAKEANEKDFIRGLEIAIFDALTKE